MKVTSDINEKGTVRVARLFALFSVMTLAVIFLLSFTTPAFAQVSMGGEWGTIKGEIMSIDHLQNATILTLMSSQMGQFPGNKLNIILTPDTKVQACKDSEPINDLSVSSNATVMYHDLGGIAVAELISEQC